jgi:hypothetical protein
MIVVDADVLWLARRNAQDPRRPVNQQFLDALRAGGVRRGVTTQGLLEAVGKFSYGTPPADIPRLPGLICTIHGLEVIPDPAAVPGYAGCTVAEVVARMVRKMSAGDAVMAVQVDRYAPAGSTLVTWNAKHFRGKLTVPVMTPAEWLLQNPPAAGPTP